MADEDLLHRVHALGDLDLAALLCLISREHCIVSTEPSELDNLIDELWLVASQTFNLSCAVVYCTPQTTLDNLAAAIQLPPPQPPANSQPQSALHSPVPRSSPSASPRRRRGTESSSYFHGTNTHVTGTTYLPPATSTTPPQIANVILAKNLDRAPKDVQIQCLELLRTRRILTRTSVQTAPKQFLFIAVLESGGAGRLVSHLNDLFYVSHWHDPEDGFAHLEGEWDEDKDKDKDGKGGDGETASLDSASSIIRRSIAESTARPSRTRSTNNMRIENQDFADRDNSSLSSSHTPAAVSISETDIASLALLAPQVNVDVEVMRYQLNIVSFIRMHRSVAPGGGGATPLATRHLDKLARCLAALHGLDYVTPSLVALAVKKVYPHRIRISPPERERSMQWGSDLAAVEALLDGVDAEYVIEDVLGMVEAPL
ncbi:hypothetical protein F5Y04DRAFT_266019 [Hypomontagnella monticulosa]|nr:hypothetical protein F5Y04DRAFT_266019 [Hypomontagnella monticulosa]